jgi:hypothetical protein
MERLRYARDKFLRRHGLEGNESDNEDDKNDESSVIVENEGMGLFVCAEDERRKEPGFETFNLLSNLSSQALHCTMSLTQNYVPSSILTVTDSFASFIDENISYDAMLAASAFATTLLGAAGATFVGPSVLRYLLSSPPPTYRSLEPPWNPQWYVPQGAG